MDMTEASAGEEEEEAAALQADLRAMMAGAGPQQGQQGQGQHDDGEDGRGDGEAAGGRGCGGAAGPIDEEWARRTRRRVVSPEYMDRLVMNYLVVEGHKEAAEALAEESGVPPPVDLRTIEDRMQVREAIMRGDVQAALAGIERVDPQLLQRDRRLAFTLRLQHLLELVRQGKAGEALVFARRELAPLGEADAENLKVLEAAMTLLVFETHHHQQQGAAGGAAAKGGGGGLLDPARRAAAAEEANAAILQAQQQESEPVLPALVRMLLEAEAELRECGVAAGGEGRDSLAATAAWFRS